MLLHRKKTLLLTISISFLHINSIYSASALLDAKKNQPLNQLANNPTKEDLEAKEKRRADKERRQLASKNALIKKQEEEEKLYQKEQLKAKQEAAEKRAVKKAAKKEALQQRLIAQQLQKSAQPNSTKLLNPLAPEFKPAQAEPSYQEAVWQPRLTQQGSIPDGQLFVYRQNDAYCGLIPVEPIIPLNLAYINRGLMSASLFTRED